MSFSDLGARPLELRMSRSSPGRYSLHEFAKNVYDVHAYDPNGAELGTTRPDADGWTVPRHGDRLRVSYKVFGDRVDGTYLAVDSTHAHINMPAVVMWGRGFDERAITVTLAEPSGAEWQAATQLHPVSPSASPAPAAGVLEFSAANLQYLMDSPIEFGPITVKEFSVDNHRFRIALHQDRSPGNLASAAAFASFAGDVEKIVRQEELIFGEYPLYEPGTYTFLADYLPYAETDGMEHRNSSVLTSPGRLPTDRDDLLDGVAHEFFHSWNVERIRPRSLEPFDFERANASGELWLAEGFTQYYGPLALSRAGLVGFADLTAHLVDLIAGVINDSAHLVRSTEEMSLMAPFVDGARPIDRTNWSNTVISYYTVGRRDRAGARSHAARPVKRKDLARRFHARHVADARQAWGEPRRLRRSSVYDRRCSCATGGSVWGSCVCARFFQPVHRRPRRS